MDVIFIEREVTARLLLSLPYRDILQVGFWSPFSRLFSPWLFVRWKCVVEAEEVFCSPTIKSTTSVTSKSRRTFHFGQRNQSNSWTEGADKRDRIEVDFGFCNVFGWMVPNFAWIAAWLNKKLMKDQQFHSGGLDKSEVQAQSSPHLKLLSPPLLPLTETRRTIYLRNWRMPYTYRMCPASRTTKRICEARVFWYRSISKAERAFDSTHRDCPAVECAVLIVAPM